MILQVPRCLHQSITAGMDFYVFDLDSFDGFNLKGTVTHSDSDFTILWNGKMLETFYIDDVLYTASEEYLKMNSFNNLEEINSLKLENTGKFIEYLEEEIIR